MATVAVCIGAPVGRRNGVLPLPNQKADLATITDLENGRAFKRACTLLPASAGRESSEAAVVRRHATQNRDLAASWIRLRAKRSRFGDDAGAHAEVFENLVGEGDRFGCVMSTR